MLHVLRTPIQANHGVAGGGGGTRGVAALHHFLLLLLWNSVPKTDNKGDLLGPHAMMVVCMDPLGKGQHSQ